MNKLNHSKDKNKKKLIKNQQFQKKNWQKRKKQNKILMKIKLVKNLIEILRMKNKD